MTFTIKMTTPVFHKDDAKDVKDAESIGFTFKPYLVGRSVIAEQESVSIEINTLEELVALTEKFGELIIQGDKLEIYNDYSRVRY